MTDEQLQKDVWDEAAKTKSLTYEDATPHQGLGPAIFLEGYTYAASPLQALLKEKEETIVCIERNYQQLLNAYEEMKAFTDKAIKEKDAEIERYKQADLKTGVEWERRAKIIDDLYAKIENLKEENERLKGEVEELTMSNMTHEYNNAEAERTWPHFKDQIEEPFKDRISELEQELTDLRALHTQQIEEAWDAAERYMSPQDYDEMPPLDKAAYISKITNQKHSI
jgi:DNA repair exonuclease SbcCD ATPase subunit